MTTSNFDWISMYHPIEHKILSEYLGCDPLISVGDVDICDGTSKVVEHVCVVPDAWGKYTDFSLPDAVARIALEIADRQPRSEDQPPRANRLATLGPKKLFAINWATSAPGCDWPESYDLNFFPGYQRHVVTATRENVNPFGYKQEAIGYFKGGSLSQLVSIGNIVRKYWSERWNETGESPPWEEFICAGLIDRGTAEEWAVQAWLGTAPEAPPRWYQKRIEDGTKGESHAATDRLALKIFTNPINEDVPFQDLPEEIQSWWINRY